MYKIRASYKKTQMKHIKQLFWSPHGAVRHAPPCGDWGGTGNAFSCDFYLNQAEQSPEFFRAFSVIKTEKNPGAITKGGIK